MLNMHCANINNNRQIGFADSSQICDLPEVVHTHFQYRNLGILGHGKNCHRHTNVIIMVSGGLAHFISAFQHCRHHFLGGAFTHRAGDAYHLHTDTIPFTTGNIAQSQAGIFHHNGGKIPILVGAKHSGCAFLQGSGNKIVTVALTLQGDKKLVFFDLPAVIIGTQEGNIFILRIHFAATPFGGLGQGNSTHYPFLVSAR